jgi:hypothetical protein
MYGTDLTQPKMSHFTLQRKCKISTKRQWLCNGTFARRTRSVDFSLISARSHERQQVPSAREASGSATDLFTNSITGYPISMVKIIVTDEHAGELNMPYY